MSAPGSGTGMLNGHGVGVAMVAIFVGMGLVVAVVASDGAIFGLDFGSSSSNSAPVIDDAGDRGTLSRDVFDQSDAGGNLTSVADTPANRSALSEEQRQLLAMGNFYWDPIAMRYIASSQDIMDKFDQQNFTRPEPARPRTGSLFVFEAERDRDATRDETVVIDEPIETPAASDEEQPDGQASNNPDDVDSSGSGGGGDSGSDSGSGDGGSGSNDTGSNSTSSDPSGGDSGSEGSSGSGNGTSTSAEASISAG